MTTKRLFDPGRYNEPHVKAREKIYRVLERQFSKLFMALRIAGYNCRDIRELILDALMCAYSMHKGLERFDDKERDDE